VVLTTTVSAILIGAISAPRTTTILQIALSAPDFPTQAQVGAFQPWTVTGTSSYHTAVTGWVQLTILNPGVSCAALMGQLQIQEHNDSANFWGTLTPTVVGLDCRYENPTVAKTWAPNDGTQTFQWRLKWTSTAGVGFPLLYREQAVKSV